MASSVAWWNMSRVRSIGFLGLVLAGLVVLYVGWDGTGTDLTTEPQPVPWSVDFDSIDRIAIALPSQGGGHTWIRGNDGGWYFERPGGTRVDNDRWGVGIPLLVSGPEAKRLIAESASDEQLSMYGFTDPLMTVEIGIAGKSPVEIEVGERTPDGSADYVRLAHSPTVYAVHHTWKDTLARLVTDPPVARE